MLIVHCNKRDVRAVSDFNLSSDFVLSTKFLFFKRLLHWQTHLFRLFGLSQTFIRRFSFVGFFSHTLSHPCNKDGIVLKIYCLDFFFFCLSLHSYA